MFFFLLYIYLYVYIIVFKYDMNKQTINSGNVGMFFKYE